MRLVSVDITNFRVLKRATVNLPDALIGIVGPNGAGKSSLVEGISWALFGQQAARSVRSEVKSAFAAGSETCEVQVVFDVHGAEHRVIRRLVGAGQRLEVELYREGKLEVVGSTETQQYIERLLGLDWRGYITSVLARQSDLDAFSGLQPAKRREHLVGMLGIDRLDRAIDRAKGEVRMDTERAMLLERQLAGLAELEAGLARTREQIEVAGRKLELVTGACTEAEGRLAQARARFTEHEAESIKCSRLESQLELAATEGGHIAEQLKRLTAERVGLALLEARTYKDRAQTAGLETLRSEVGQMERVRESAAARTRIRNDRDSIMARLKGTESKQQQVSTKVVETRKSIEQVPAVSTQELDEARRHLETERERYVQLTEQKKQAEKEVQKVRENLTQIANLGGEAVCSRCLRPYGDDIAQIRNHLEEERAQVESAIRQLSELLKESTRNGAAAKERVSVLEKGIEQRRVLRQTLELAEAEQREVEAQRSALAEQRESLDRQLRESGEAEFDEARYKDVSGRLKQLEQIQRKVAEAEGELKRLPVVEQSLRELSQNAESVERRIQEFRELRSAITIDQGAFEQARLEVEQSTARYQSAHDEQMKAAHRKELLTQEAESTERRWNELNAIAADLKVVRERRSRADRLTKIFGDLRRNLVAGIRPRLAELASQLLDDMTSGRYNLMELDEDYNISIFDDGQAYGIDRFSGGENDLANLCLRLAVSLALAESAGLERSLIILDEVFGSQDENRRERIYQGLAGLKPRFPQIIAITHIEELKNRVETIIEIEPTGKGWSEVRVDGALA